MLPHLPNIASPKGTDSDDTLNIYRVTFPEPINEIVLEDFCNLIAVPCSMNWKYQTRRILKQKLS